MKVKKNLKSPFIFWLPAGTCRILAIKFILFSKPGKLGIFLIQKSFEFVEVIFLKLQKWKNST